MVNFIKSFNMINILNIFTDGGSRGNPGPSAIGIYVADGKNKKIAGFGRAIGLVTNNAAEYKAVIAALDWVIENKKAFSSQAKIYFFLDSKLAYSQIVGLFKIKNSDLRSLLFEVRDREAQIDQPIYYKHIPREQNTKADALVNQALDQQPSFDV